MVEFLFVIDQNPCIVQDNLEEWMKILACASYEYMKLMVMELQQQLAELDEAERLGAVDADVNADSLQQQPKAPPRQQRTNPFNPAESSRKKASGTVIWLRLHQTLGSKIVNDREQWCKLHSGDISKNNVMIES